MIDVLNATGGDAAESTGSGASGAASASKGTDAVGMAVGFATSIATTIASIDDAAKRRKFDQALSLLTNSQTRELNNKLAAIQDKNEKIRILSESITRYLTENANARAKSETIMYLVAGGLGTVLLVMVVIFTIKGK